MRRCLLVVLVLFIASGCGGVNNGKSVKHGGTLRIAVIGGVQADPAKAQNHNDFMLARLLYAPLLSYGKNMKPQAGVATKWTSNSEQTEFHLTLNTNRRFSDGSPITATDAVATLLRVRDANPALPLTSLLGIMSQVKAVDERTLDIKLSQSFGEFPSLLAQPSLGIVSVNPAKQPAVGNKNALTSGDFTLQKQSDNELQLERSPYSTVALNGVDLDLVTSIDSAQVAFHQNKINAVSLMADSNVRSKNIVQAPYGAIGVYAINLRDPMFSDIRFREAILRAMDNKKLETSGYGSGASAATGLIPSNVFDAPKNNCGKACENDPKRVSELLHQVFPTGSIPAVHVDFDEGSIQQAMAEEAVKQLKAAGIPAETRVHPANEYSDFVANGGAEVFRFGWVGEYPAGTAFLSPWFMSNAPENATGFASADVDASISTALSSGSQKTRTQALSSSETNVLNDFAVLPVVQFESRFEISAHVQGFTVDALGTFNPALISVK